MAGNVQNIIRKVQKLLELAKGQNNNSEAEANAAMEKAQSLMAAYNLNLSLLEEETGAKQEGRSKEQSTKSAQYRYQQRLWHAVSASNFCWHWTVSCWRTKEGKPAQKATKRHCVVGRESNVNVTTQMALYLEQTMERLVPVTNSERLGRYAISWKTGCAERLIERIEERSESLKRKSDAVGTSTGDGKGLTLQSVEDREYRENYDFLYGEGSWAARQKRMADIRASQESTTLTTEEAEEKPETESQRKARERRYERMERQAAAKRRKEAEKIDWRAYDAGSSAAESISLDAQVERGKDTRRIS